jgi:hypothetical protein
LSENCGCGFTVLLYNLTADPNEHNDISKEQPETVERSFLPHKSKPSLRFLSEISFGLYMCAEFTQTSSGQLLDKTMTTCWVLPRQTGFVP